MHICIDARGAVLYKYTGIGTYTENLTTNILKEDLRNEYTIFWNNNMYPKDINNENTKYQLFPMNIKSEFDDIYIPELLNFYKPDIYHIPQNGLDMPLNIETKCIITIHDIIPIVMPDSCGEGYYNKFKSKLPYVLEKSSHIITVSDYSKRDLMTNFNVSEDKVSVIYEGRNSDYKVLNKRSVNARLKEKYDIDYKYILYVGGFNKRKNVKNLIIAFERFLIKTGSDIKLVLLGNGREVEELKTLSNLLKISDKVIFKGFIIDEDMPLFYNGALFFVYPSLYEGFGLPLVEAMSSGCPFITSTFTSLPEISGDAGITVDTNSTSDLSDAMIELYEDKNLRLKLRKKGLARSLLFNWEECAARTIEVYEKFEE